MKFFFYLFFLIILSGSVFAVAMSSPSGEQTSYVFEPNLEITKTYTVWGDEGTNFGLFVEVFGPQKLDEYITTQPESVSGKGQIFFNLKLPEKIEGGLYNFWICASEVKGQDAALSYEAQVCRQLFLLATFPGKILKINSFSAPDTDIDSDSINLSLSVSNWGREKINSVGGKFTVYNINNDFMAQVAIAERFSLNSTETNSYMIPLTIKALSPGEYTIKGTIDWDENQSTVEDSFRIGSAAFEILNITQEFISGEVNDLWVTIRNDYGGAKSPVSLTIAVGEQSVTPPAFSINAFEEKTIKTFLDARNLEPGFYDANVLISVDGESVENSFKLEIKSKPIPKWPFYISGAVILVVLVFLFVMKKRKNEKEEIKL